DPQTRQHLKDHLFEDLLPLDRFEAAETNALLAELNDFAASIRDQRQPIVTGQQGRDCLAVAEQILQSIEGHLWDGSAAGRVGPLAMPTAAILRGPHWSKTPDQTQRRREAGETGKKPASPSPSPPLHTTQHNLPATNQTAGTH